MLFIFLKWDSPRDAGSEAARERVQDCPDPDFCRRDADAEPPDQGGGCHHAQRGALP